MASTPVIKPAAMEKNTTISEYLMVTTRLFRKAGEVSRLVKLERPTNLLISPFGVVEWKLKNKVLAKGKNTKQVKRMRAGVMYR